MREPTALERLFKADIAKRPPHEAEKSFQAFQTLVQQYPKSPYAADARQRMVYLRNRLADYQIAVARYYMKRGAYVGAANRARGVIEIYDGAPAADDALAILAECLSQARGERPGDGGRQRPEGQRLARPAQHGPVAPTGGGTAAAAGTERRRTRRQRLAVRRTRAGRALGSHRGPGVVQARPDVDFEGGTSATIDSSLGFMRGRGLSLHVIACGSGRLSLSTRRTTRRRSQAKPRRTRIAIEGSLDTMSLMLDVAYTFLDGPVTPYVVGGVGWAWVDTNVASEPPEVGCWWHPWWGYICTSWQDTRTVDGLAYELGLGVRYSFTDFLAADVAYRMRWMDFENATSTPSFDNLQLNLVWKF